MTIHTTLSQAASMASHTASEWLVEAAKAERNGDVAFRDRCLSEAERKSADAEWYRERAEMFALPLTYPKIEAKLEVAE